MIAAGLHGDARTGSKSLLRARRRLESPLVFPIPSRRLFALALSSVFPASPASPPPLSFPERKLNPGRNSSFIAKTDCRQFHIFGPACQESGSRPRQLASRSLQVLLGSIPIKQIFSKADARFHMRIVHSGTALPDAADRGVHSIAFKIGLLRKPLAFGAEG